MRLRLNSLEWGSRGHTGGVDCCAFPRLPLKPLGAAPNHGTVLLIEAVVSAAHWSPSICRSQDAIRLQLALFWSTTLTLESSAGLK